MTWYYIALFVAGLAACKIVLDVTGRHIEWETKRLHRLADDEDADYRRPE